MQGTGKLAAAAAVLPIVWWAMAGIVYGSGIEGDLFMAYSIVSLGVLVYVATLIGYRAGRIESRETRR